jgi:hypothetical protein
MIYQLSDDQDNETFSQMYSVLNVAPDHDMPQGPFGAQVLLWALDHDDDALIFSPDHE